MASEQVIELTDSNFKEEVIESEMPVMVDFWAEWCYPCKMLAPTIGELAKDFAGKIKVGKVDTDSNREIPLKYGISAIPTVMVFKGGQLVRKFVGIQNKADLKDAINDVLK